MGRENHWETTHLSLSVINDSNSKLLAKCIRSSAANYFRLGTIALSAENKRCHNQSAKDSTYTALSAKVMMQKSFLTSNWRDLRDPNAFQGFTKSIAYPQGVSPILFMLITYNILLFPL